MRAVWCHERNAHAFGSRRNALVEYYTPEHAVKVTVTVSSHEVKLPIGGTLHATGGCTEGRDYGVYACCVMS